MTGRVAFDSMGDRIYAEYQVINVQEDPRSKKARRAIVGNYQYSKVSNNQKSFNEGWFIKPNCCYCLVAELAYFIKNLWLYRQA